MAFKRPDDQLHAQRNIKTRVSACHVESRVPVVIYLFYVHPVAIVKPMRPRTVSNRAIAEVISTIGDSSDDESGAEAMAKVNPC